MFLTMFESELKTVTANKKSILFSQIHSGKSKKPLDNS